MPTMKDVAKKARVSTSTVSYVINNVKPVKPETRQRILNAIEELHYKPNLVARSLKTSQTLTIGVIIPDMANTFFTEVFRGIEDVAYKHGYTSVLCNTYEDEYREIQYLDALLNKGIDGLIFIGTEKNLHILDNTRGIPTVIVDRKLGSDIASVTVDNEHGGYLATDYLIAQGYTEILFFTGPLSINTYFERMTGYMHALKAHGLRYSELFLHECQISYDGGQAALDRLYGRRPLDSAAIFAANDLIALGVLKALIKRGVPVPGTISLVGYDDIAAASIVTPALTTIRQPTYRMGVKAVEVLLRQIAGNAAESEHVVLEPELVVRETA